MDRAANLLMRLTPVLNVSRPVVVAQRPAEAEGNPWAGFRVVRGKG